MRNPEAGQQDLAQRIGLITAPGSGLPCDSCHTPIAPDQVEFRCVAADSASAASARLHQWCYYARTLALTKPCAAR